MLRKIPTAALAAAALTVSVWAQDETSSHRMRAAAEVLQDSLSAPDRGVPRDLLEKAFCVVIVPGLKKGAFVFGGDYGRGFAVCRRNGGWGGPAAIRFGGGSFGAQIGVESTDVVLLVMNRHGLDKLATDKFTLGADASVAGGPVGRTAAADTDAAMKAEILSYSRAHGVFAGVSLDGTVVTKDGSEDRKLYGKDMDNKAILEGEVSSPPGADVLLSVLGRYPQTR